MLRTKMLNGNKYVEFKNPVRSGFSLRTGQVVRVRTWDDMKTQYGTTSYGEAIKIPLTFNTDMRYMCGQLYVVGSVTRSDVSNYFRVGEYVVGKEMCVLIGNVVSDDFLSWYERRGGLDVLR